MFSTNSTSTSQSLTAMSQQFLSLYQQLKGVLMQIINGKLVHQNLLKGEKLDSKFQLFFSDIEESEIQLDKIQQVSLSLQILEQKLTNLETEKIGQINHQLNQFKAKINQQIIALTAASFIGFISLGISIVVKVNPSISEPHYPTYMKSLK